MNAGAPIDCAFQPSRLDMRDLGGPVTAEATAHDRDALAVDIAPRFEMIDGRRKSPFGPWLLAEAGIFPCAWHINRKSRQSFLVKHLAIRSAIFLPTIDSTPVHHNGWTTGSVWNL
jgi:hypothetical protein